VGIGLLFWPLHHQNTCRKCGLMMIWKKRVNSFYTEHDFFLVKLQITLTFPPLTAKEGLKGSLLTETTSFKELNKNLTIYTSPTCFIINNYIKPTLKRYNILPHLLPSFPLAALLGN
jgi:hypothetical protein